MPNCQNETLFKITKDYNTFNLLEKLPNKEWKALCSTVRTETVMEWVINNNLNFTEDDIERL